MDDKSDDGFAAGRRYWRTFAPLWIAPVTVLLAFGVAQRIGHPLLAWWLVAMPVGVWASIRALRPGVSGRIACRQQVLLGIVAPWLVWVVLMFLFDFVGVTK
jgi:hypothetical protein